MQIRQKTREVCIALIKISVGSRRNEMRQRLERLAFELLNDVSSSDFEGVLRRLETVRGLIQFGRTIYEIEPITAELIDQECGNLSTSIKEMTGIDFESDIGAIFKKDQEQRISIKIEKTDRKKKQDNNAAIGNNAANTVSNNAAKISMGSAEIGAVLNNTANNAAMHSDAAKNNAAIGNNAANAAIDKFIAEKKLIIDWSNAANRQSAIIEKIRQWDDKQVQLKDLLNEFGDISERTLRYDLQKLCSQGILERVGLGGPSSYYKVRVL